MLYISLEEKSRVFKENMRNGGKIKLKNDVTVKAIKIAVYFFSSLAEMKTIFWIQINILFEPK